MSEKPKYVGAAAAAKQAALIKAYVDSKMKKDFVVNITFDSTSAPAVIDDSNIAVFNASTDKTFAEISSAVAAGKNVYGMWNGHKWPLYLSSSTSHAFRGHIQLANLFGTVGLAIAICSIWQDGCNVEVSAGELPVPALDGTDDGKCIVVSGHKWTMKKAVVDVDDAMSGTSENPVQNKAINTAIEAVKASITTLTNSLKNKLDKSGGMVTGSLLAMKGLISNTYVQFGTTFPVKFYKTADDCVKLGLAADDDGSAPGIRLKAGTPTEADDVATKSYVDSNASGGGAGVGAVRYDVAQTLEFAQQAQARRNIDAAPQDTPNFTGYITLTPPNGDMGHGVGMTASVAGGGHQYALNISDVDEGEPTLLTGVKTPTDANTNAAATVEYVLGKALPAVTAADNGKVLRVVNSAWSAEDMPTGGTDMGITGASVGQIAKITAVDESGVPTAWSPVDMPTGGGGETWEEINVITLADAANTVTINTDSSGNAFALKKVRILIEGSASKTQDLFLNNNRYSRASFVGTAVSVGALSAEPFCGKMYCFAVPNVTSNYAAVNQMVNIFSGEITITDIKIIVHDANTFSAGTKFTIEGVRT